MKPSRNGRKLVHFTSLHSISQPLCIACIAAGAAGRVWALWSWRRLAFPSLEPSRRARSTLQTATTISLSSCPRSLAMSPANGAVTPPPAPHDSPAASPHNAKRKRSHANALPQRDIKALLEDVLEILKRYARDPCTPPRIDLLTRPLLQLRHQPFRPRPAHSQPWPSRDFGRTQLQEGEAHPARRHDHCR